MIQEQIKLQQAIFWFDLFGQIENPRVQPLKICWDNM